MTAYIRRSLQTLVFILVLTFHANSQNAIGLKLSGNYNYLGYSFEEGYGDRFGYGGGAFALIEIIPMFYLNPEISYTFRSIDLFNPTYLNDDFNGNDVRLGLNYIDIPFNFGYGLFMDPEVTGSSGGPTFLMFHGGPHFSLINRQNNKIVSRRERAVISDDGGNIDQIRNFQFGINLGITAGIGNIYLDARYYYALTSLLDYDAIGDNMSSITLTVGYMIIFK
jgi:hypothetical protein